MAIRQATYAFARPAPYLLERGATQTLTAPIRHGSGGGLIAPDSGTITITRPDGTEFVSGQAVTVSSSTATYTVSPSASETLGDGWTVLWTLTFSGVVYPTFRQSAYLVKYVPPNVVSEHELYARVPELQHRVPQSQGPTDRGGSGEGWQPQIDEAYFELIQKMLDDGKKPWLVREVTGYRKWLLTRALQLCVGTISFGPDSTWSEQSKRLYFEMNKVQSDMRFQLENDDGGTRRGAVPALRIAAVGRPLWT
jgi:hypothetical protein